MRRLLLALVVAAAPAALAQPVALAPGDPSLDLSWMASGTDTLTIRLVAPMRQDIGTVVQRTTVADGVLTTVSRVRIAMQGLTMTDSVRTSATTLAPLTHHSTGGPRPASLEYTPEGVVGLAGTDAVAELLDAPVFDGAAMNDLVRSLPFAAGYLATVSTFDTQRGLVDGMLAVAGREDVAAGGATVAAWVVEWTTHGADGQPLTATYLVHPDTRALLATRFSPQPNVTVEVRPAR